MDFSTFNSYCTHGIHRTYIFTSTASYTSAFGNHRASWSVRRIIVRIQFHHAYCLNWTVTCAETAFCYTLNCKAFMKVEMCKTYGDICFLRMGYRSNCTSRTYLRTTVTFRTAITVVIIHHRLHEAFCRCGWLQNPVGACGYAELAGRAMCIEILYT